MTTKVKKLLGAIFAIVLIATVVTVYGSSISGSGLKKHENTANAKQASLRWFQISGSHAPGTAVPPADATYLGEGTTPPPADECPDGTNNQCISGFNTNQTMVVNGNRMLNGSQTPATVSATRN